MGGTFYSQCQLPEGFDSCKAKAIIDAVEESIVSNKTATEAERIAVAKRKAAQMAANAQNNVDQAKKSAQKSEEMDKAAATAEAKARQQNKIAEQASKLEARLYRNAKKWEDAIKAPEHKDMDGDDKEDK